MIERVAGLFRLSRRELLVLVLVFLASLPAVTTRLYSSDEVQYYSYLRSLWFDRDVSFENEYRYYYERGIAQTPDFYEAFLVMETPTGRRLNFGTIGSAILWAPFYAVADVGVRLARAGGRDVPADGFSPPYVAAVAYGSAFYAFAAVLLGIGVARRLLGPVSILPALAVWVGTPLLFYAYVAPPFAHATSAFAVAVFITIWLQVRGRWTITGAVGLGLSGALMTMVREQDMFFVIGPALDFAIDAVGARGPVLRARAAAAAAGVAAFILGWLPQLLAYQALNGRPGPSQYVTRKMLWHSPFAPYVLFDPHHGFFFWTPLAVLALAGLALLAGGWWRGDAGDLERSEAQPRDAGRERPGVVASAFRRTVPDTRRVAALLLLMVGLQVYVSGAVESWTVAGAFGQRRFVAVTTMLIVGLSALWMAAAGRSAAGTRRGPAFGVMAALVALCIWWNLGLIALFGTRMMDRQRIDVRRNAYDVFVTLPIMAPDLAWRYVSARESFYGPPRADQAPQ